MNQVFFQEKIIELLQSKYALFEPQLFVLFGSYANNTAWNTSDIDIGFLMKTRISEGFLSALILDCIRISGCDHVNLIDLYYKETPELVQAEIYRTGKVLLEVTSGLFDTEKTRAGGLVSYKKEIEYNVHIANDKLAMLKKTISELSEVAQKRYEDDWQLLATAEKKAEDALRQVIKLNKFMLQRFFSVNPKNAHESFVLLSKTELFSDADLEYLTETIIFPSAETIDYLYGSTWSVGLLIKRMLSQYPEYINKWNTFIVENSKS